ncbi:hypothetical protein CCYA_CCYA12G3235 [Cyanidiococcus yangmingshanensis]|uniref:NADP-dependent glyceraldehyde-3-phosphate dehydrogenase n=1 Tax=Cyanidiococcus yangmingshanensis TaxID=2690220 RepID=A0A7J7IG22_9RHOD|nr:hypothetical protein F1559_003973 [Cyanidiococcus yangmingshanensis]KAK4532378.1 hypothetical protein CCYA_CCYA12G3235 [Cyanidiococcus yangmingshanensis]
MTSTFASIHEGNTYFLLLNGKFVQSESGKTITGETPFDGTPTYTIQAATKAEIDRAYESAALAQRSWRQVALWKRAEIVHKAATILREHVDEIATVILREVGKNRKSAVSEVLRTADLCDYTAEEGLRMEGQLLVSDSYPGQPRNKLCLVQRVPLGVVLAQGPFNYPCNLTGSKVAPALMAGNSCVVKGPTQGAVAALYLTAAFHFAGVPAGVVNYISGRGSEIGDYLVTHPLCNCISFTGGNIGLEVAKKAHMIPMQMELGGKDAAIVCDDADLDLAAKCIVSGAFSYSGQRCTAVKLVLAVESIADELVQKVVERTRALTVGHPEDDCEVTAVINKAAADYAESLAMDAKEKGAKFLLEYRREGNLIHPLVVDRVDESMKLAWEEPFAPVLPVMRVKDERAAVAFANRLRYGLQGCVFTRDVNRAIMLSSEITAGTIQVNGAPARGPDHFLFLGHKDSGINAQGAKWSIEAMTKLKSVVINLPQEAYMIAN